MNRANKILSYFAILSILLLIVNNVLFTHFHHLENGEIVVHAHPYNIFAENDQSKANHKHTDSELLLADFLYSLLFKTLITLSFMVIVLETICKFNYLYFCSYLKSIDKSQFKIRPPPQKLMLVFS